MLVVKKFGGTSVANKERIFNRAEKPAISGKISGHRFKKAVRKYSPRVQRLHFLRSVRWWKPPGR